MTRVIPRAGSTPARCVHQQFGSVVAAGIPAARPGALEGIAMRAPGRTQRPNEAESIAAFRGAWEQILDEHAELRERLAEIESLLRRIGAGDGEAARSLSERGLSLYDRLHAHLDHEERTLVPLLRVGGEDGARCAHSLQREHADQRELLGFLSGRLRQRRRPTELVVRELHSFLACLREDMAREEALLTQATSR